MKVTQNDSGSLDQIQYQVLPGAMIEHDWMCVRQARVRHLVTLWTVVHQAPLSLGFSEQEY